MELKSNWMASPPRKAETGDLKSRTRKCISTVGIEIQDLALNTHCTCSYQDEILEI